MGALWAMAGLLWFGGSALTVGAIGWTAAPNTPALHQAATAPAAAVRQVVPAQQAPPPQKPAAEGDRNPDVVGAASEHLGVRIVSPAASEAIAGRTSVRAEVFGDDAEVVAAVDFFIDGRMLFSDARAPYELLWSPGQPAPHRIEVRAYGPGRTMASDVVLTGSASPIASPSGYEARVERVEVHVRVADKSNHAWDAAVDESSFVVLENGIEQPVVAVERVADLPLAVGLLIDHSGSMLEQLETALDAAGAFVGGLLVHPNDKVFTLGFADIPMVLQEFTNDEERLRDSMTLIEAGRYTALYDSVVVAAGRFAGIDGRRALVLLTDGADEGSDHGLRDAIAAAQRADVVLYPVAVDLSPRFVRERWVLRELAEQTGGRLFSLGRRTDPASIYEAIESDLRSQYRVSYAPLRPGGEGEWRGLEIRLASGSGGRLTVRSRPGYFAQ